VYDLYIKPCFKLSYKLYWIIHPWINGKMNLDGHMKINNARILENWRLPMRFPIHINQLNGTYQQRSCSWIEIHVIFEEEDI